MQIYPHKAKINANIASIYAIINPKMPLRDISGAFDWIVIFSKHSMLSFHEVFGQNTELFLEALGEIGRSIEAGHIANLIDFTLSFL